jgi:HPt (histidine-containing phosphotransfer) domain-containing protein
VVEDPHLRENRFARTHSDFDIAQRETGSYNRGVMETLKAIDIDHLMEASGGDRELAAELVHLYLDLTDKELVLLEKATVAGDAAAAHSIAHKCAGSSFTCGMNELARILKHLEYETSLGMLEHAPALIKQVNEQMCAVKASLTAFLDSVKPSP